MTRADFIKKYGNAVITSTYGTGIFPSVKMAQMIIESANSKGVPGASSLASKYNNFFGIKADRTWKGKAVNLSTGEHFNGKDVMIVDGFRVYNSVADSLKDHTDFVLKFSRYDKALNAETPEEQAKLLQSAGYATSPTYASALISIINANNLKELDKKKDLCKP